MYGKHLSVSAVAASIIFVVCGSVGCDDSSSGGGGGDTGGSPAFNAIDTSIQCPAGEIGWNYTTGGSNTGNIQSNAVEGIQVLSASYGENCSADNTANESAIASGACNGLASCGLKIGLPQDPAVNCAKDFRTTWQCGNETQIYSGTVPGESGGRTFTYTCAPQIHVQYGTYGANCGVQTGGAGGKDTIALHNACDDQRTCTFTENNTGPDPKYGCAKDFEATYTCGSNPYVYTSTIPGEANGKSITITCPSTPIVNIHSATWGADCGVPAGNITASVQAACANKASCNYTVNGPDPKYGCAKDLNVSWDCGVNSTVQTASYPAEVQNKTFTFSCAGVTPLTQSFTPVTTGRTACVPQTCHWNQSRDANENCVDDATPPPFTNIGLNWYRFFITDDPADVFNQVTDTPGQAASQTVAIQHLLANTPYTMVVTMSMLGAPFEATLEPWMTYRFTKSSDGSQIDGFLCALSPIDIASTVDSIDSNETIVGSFVESAPLPSQCFDGRSNPWADAAARLGISEAVFRQQYVYGNARLHFSFDPEGAIGSYNQSYSHPAQYLTAPNPPGFFYNAKSGFTDMVAFYQQRELTTTVADFNNKTWASQGMPNQVIADVTPFGFFEPYELSTTLSNFNLRSGAALDVDFFAPQGPYVTVDVGWKFQGDNPLNPYSPSTTNPSSSVQTLTNANMRATVEIYPTGNPGASIPIGSLPLTGGVPTGAVATGTMALPSTVRDAIFGPWINSTSFGLKTCIDVDGVNTRTGGFSYEETSKYIASFGPCITQDSVINVSRSLINRPIVPQQPSSNVSNGDNTSKGDNSNTANDATVAEKNCVNTTVNGVTTSQSCNSYSSTGATGGGSIAKSYYSSTSSTTHTKDASGDTGTTEQNAEVLGGFTVLDPSDDDSNGNWGPSTQVNETHTVTVSPNFDTLIDSFNRTMEEPGVHPEATSGLYGGHQGIGVGFGYRQLITPYGQIDISASVGISIGLTFNYTNVQSNPYPCINSTGSKCYQLQSSSLTQSAAAKACEVAGGELAEISTATDWAALQQVATGNQGYWVGGQLDYEYSTPACARNQSSPSCIAASKTHYRWLGSDLEFASATSGPSTSSSSSVGGFTLCGGFFPPCQPKTAESPVTFVPSALGAPQPDFNLTTFVPNAAGIAYNGASKTFTSELASTTNTPVCAFDAAASTSYEQFDVTAQIGAGAGINLQWCWPSDEIGVCIVGSLEIIGIEIDPGVHHFITSLYDAKGRKFGTRGDSSVAVTWQASLLAGEVDFIATFLFYSVSYKLFQYPGYVFGQGTLAQYDWPSRENF